MPRSRESYELDALGERIAALSAHIQAATYQLLVMLRDFDQRDGWGGGFRSCAHWLNWRTGLNLGAAREKVRIARALAELPLISASMERGEISYSKVRALTRIASPKTEKELLAFARDGTASHVEKLVRYWRRAQRFTDEEYQKRLPESRYCRVYTDDDGMVIVRRKSRRSEGGSKSLRTWLSHDDRQAPRSPSEDRSGYLMMRS